MFSDAHILPSSCRQCCLSNLVDPRSQTFSLFGRNDKQQTVHSGCNQAKVSEQAYPLVYKQNGGSRWLVVQNSHRCCGRSPSVPETEAPRSSTSRGMQLPQEKIVNKSTDSGSDKQENLPKTLPRLREFLVQTNDKPPKLDDCKRTAAGHLKYCL